METFLFDSVSDEETDASLDETAAALAALSAYLDGADTHAERVPRISRWLKTTRLEAIGVNTRSNSPPGGWC